METKCWTESYLVGPQNSKEHQSRRYLNFSHFFCCDRGHEAHFAISQTPPQCSFSKSYPTLSHRWTSTSHSTSIHLPPHCLLRSDLVPNHNHKPTPSPADLTLKETSSHIQPNPFLTPSSYQPPVYFHLQPPPNTGLNFSLHPDQTLTSTLFLTPILVLDPSQTLSLHSLSKAWIIVPAVMFLSLGSFSRSLLVKSSAYEMLPCARDYPCTIYLSVQHPHQSLGKE